MDLPNPEERQLKAKLARLVKGILTEKAWTQNHAAQVLGITQPDDSDLTRGRLKNFSVERLLQLLTRLERTVTITIGSADKRTPDNEIVLPALTSTH